MSNVVPLFTPAEVLVKDIFEAIDKHVDDGMSEFEIIGILDMVKHTFIDALGDDSDEENEDE